MTAARGSIVRKWRPPLAVVLGGTLLVVLGLPLVGLIAMRVAAPVIGWTSAAVAIGFCVLLATAVLGWLLTRLILKPSSAMVLWADTMRGSPGDPVPVPTRFGTREFSAMARSLMTMGEELQARVADLSTYSSHVTHELRSPLTTIRAAAELLETETDPQQRADLIASIGEAAARMEDLLVAMRALAQAEATVPVSAAYQPVGSVAQSVAGRLGLVVTVEGHPLAPMSKTQLELVFDHLLSNAKDHGADEVHIAPVQSGFAVTDNGRGVSQKNADKVFDPFFTTRRDGGGMGLGLFLVQRIVQSRGGKVTLAGTQFGARFELCFQLPADNLP